MKVDVTTQILIACSLAEVSAYTTDPDNAPTWYVNIKSVAWETPKPLAIGSKLTFKASFLGRKLEYSYEVVEFIPGKKLVMQTADGPFPMETTYSWEAIEDGQTRMTLRNRGNSTGFSKWVIPFMSLAMRRANKKDLKRLKQLLERKN